MELKARTVNAIKWNLLSTTLVTIIGFVQVWLLSYILPPNEYGIVGAGVIVANFFGILVEFGISNSLIRKSEITDIELSSLFLASIGLSIAGFVAAFITSPWIATFFRSPEMTLQVRILALIFLLSPFSQQPKAILAKDLQFTFVAQTAITSAIVMCLSAATLAYFYRVAWVAPVASVLAALVSSVMLSLHVRHRLSSHFAFSWSALRPHFWYSIHTVMDSMLNAFSVNTFPLLIGRLVDMTAIGQYNLANTMTIVLTDRMKPVLSQSLFPALARIQDDDERLARNFLLATTYGALVTFPMLIGLIVTGTALVHVLFEPVWWPISDLVKILAATALPRTLDAPVISLLLVKAKLHINVRIGILKLLLGIGLAYYLGSIFGIKGVVSSFLLIQLANTTLGYFLMIRPCLSNIGLPYLRSIVIPLLHTLPIVVVGGLLSCFPITGHGPFDLSLSIACGAIAYICGIFVSPFQVVQDFRQLAMSHLPQFLGQASVH